MGSIYILVTPVPFIGGKARGENGNVRYNHLVLLVGTSQKRIIILTKRVTAPLATKEKQVQDIDAWGGHRYSGSLQSP